MTEAPKKKAATKKGKSKAVVTRDKFVGFYLSDQDAFYLRDVAHRSGFKSTSHMLTALVEPLLLGGLSLMSFVRSARRIQQFAESRGVEFTADSSSLADLFKPEVPPAIPEEEISIDQLRRDLEQVVTMIEDGQRRQHNTNKLK
jgi:hypothetical protein